MQAQGVCSYVPLPLRRSTLSSLIRYCKATKDHLVRPPLSAIHLRYRRPNHVAGTVGLGPSRQRRRPIRSSSTRLQLCLDVKTFFPIFSTMPPPIALFRSRTSIRSPLGRRYIGILQYLIRITHTRLSTAVRQVKPSRPSPYIISLTRCFLFHC